MENLTLKDVKRKVNEREEAIKSGSRTVLKRVYQAKNTMDLR